MQEKKGSCLILHLQECLGKSPKVLPTIYHSRVQYQNIVWVCSNAACSHAWSHTQTVTSHVVGVSYLLWGKRIQSCIFLTPIRPKSGVEGQPWAHSVPWYIFLLPTSHVHSWKSANAALHFYFNCTAHQLANTISDGGGSIILWGCISPGGEKEEWMQPNTKIPCSQ